MSAVDDDPVSSSAPASSSRPRLSHSATISTHHCECHNWVINNHASPSPYSSPHSASLPSPPESPSLDPYADIDLDSISSFPSVSSSVFFSSSAGSPHSQPRNLEQEHDGLIIPSLTLPSKLQQPTPYGQTLGDLSLLLVGPSGGGKTALAEFLADGDEILDVSEWEDIDGGRVLRASTDWIEEYDPHGLERFEGAENVSFTELDGFDYAVNPKCVAERVLKHIHDTFDDVRSQIESKPSSTLLHSLLSSSHSPLYTALIYVTATPLTEQDREIVSILSSSIPVILVCTAALSSSVTSFSHGVASPPKLASFQPHSQLSLRTGLFCSPQTISTLRIEAADRFMRWHEAERCVENIIPPIRSENKLYSFTGQRRSTVTRYSSEAEEIDKWNKAAWEVMLSEDVARRLRQTRSSEKPVSSLDSSSLANSILFRETPCFTPSLDPLHLRSLMLLSVSLFAPRSPLAFRPSRSKSRGMAMDETHSTVRPRSSNSRGRSRKGQHKREAISDRWRIWRWGLALFCAGVGIGCVLSAIA
ncbi:hypothetical protein ACEPAI_4322 [Sanghuangporus weigelae]